MDLPVLHADCARCSGLCCMSLVFDRSAAFAFDKPAGEACRHLDDDHRCAIHDERDARGLSGCVGYDCRGAGQRVTQELFGGKSWRSEPALEHAMSDAFWRVRELHELLELLQAAGQLQLAPEQREAWRKLCSRCHPPQGLSRPMLAALDIERLGRDVQVFLATLREHVTGRKPGALPRQAGKRRLPLWA